MESDLFKLSKEYESNYFKINKKNNNQCSLGLGCKEESKKIILYLFISIIIIISTSSLIMNITYSINEYKNLEKNLIEDELQFIKDTNIKYNKYGNLFITNIVYE